MQILDFLYFFQGAIQVFFSMKVFKGMFNFVVIKIQKSKNKWEVLTRTASLELAC